MIVAAPSVVERISRNLAIVDDAARRDGGHTTDEERIPPANLDRIKDKSVDHTRDEVGS